MRNLQPNRIKGKDIPTALKKWLYASGSLTQQLTDLGGGEFHVERIREHYQRLAFDDSKWMDMPAHHIAWVRETYLYGSESQAWVKAKSIFPILSLQKKPEYLNTSEISQLVGFYFNVRILPVKDELFIPKRVGRGKVVILGMDVNLLYRKLSCLDLNSLLNSIDSKDSHGYGATNYMATAFRSLLLFMSF